MAQVAKQESQVDIKSSAERFHKAFCYQQNMLSKMCPEIVQDIQLVKGDWQSAGSLRKWIYAPSGDNPTSEVGLILTEAIDDKNKSTTLAIIDGDLNKMYNFYRFTIQVTENGNGSTVKSTQEYQKVSPDFPEPTRYLEFAAWLYKSMDAYLVDRGLLIDINLECLY